MGASSLGNKEEEKQTLAEHMMRYIAMKATCTTSRQAMFHNCLGSTAKYQKNQPQSYARCVVSRKTDSNILAEV